MNTIPSYFFTIFNSYSWKIRSNFLPPKRIVSPIAQHFFRFFQTFMEFSWEKAVSQLIRGIDFDTPAAAECLRVRLTAEAETPTRLGLAFRTSLSEKNLENGRKNQHFSTEAHEKPWEGPGNCSGKVKVKFGSASRIWGSTTLSGMHGMHLQMVQVAVSDFGGGILIKIY